MDKKQISILSLGYTKELLRDTKNAKDDSVNRLNFYAKNLEEYFILVLSLKKEKLKRRHVENMDIRPTNGSNFLFALIKMYKIGKGILKNNKVDVIQAQEPFLTGIIGYLLKKKYKKPLNICIYGSNPFDKYWRKESLFNFMVAPIAKFIIKHADGLQVDGTLTLNSLHAHGIPKDRIVFKPMIPSNIRTFSEVSGNRIKKELTGNSIYSKILLFVGRMAKQKNIPFLLSAVALVIDKNPKVRIVMIGSGSEKKKCQKLGKKLGIEKNILWLDGVPHHEIPQYYKASDVLVVGSYYEGFPRIFMEAASAGKPIVTTYVSGVGDGVIDGKNGYVVEQGDMQGFSAKINELLMDNELADKLGSNGQKLMQEKYFDPEPYNEKQLEIWESLAL